MGSCSFIFGEQMDEKVNHPTHYNQYNGLEIIDLVEQMNFNKGNAVKYITRAGFKDSQTEIEDLKKARWYIDREIERLTKNSEKSNKLPDQCGWCSRPWTDANVDFVQDVAQNCYVCKTCGWNANMGVIEENIPLCNEAGFLHDWNKKKSKWKCNGCGKTRRARSIN